MANPLGQGEKRHPHAGNTTLMTYDQGGRKVFTPLWINQFSTDLNLQVDSAQVRDRLIHRPIRMTERFLTFSTLWNVLDRPKYAAFIGTLRDHWVYNLNEAKTATPMKLTYYGANKTWMGFIEAANIGYAVTDVVLTYTFQMRIVPSLNQKWSRVTGVPAPYVPTAADVTDFGDLWYTTGEFIGLNIGTGHESAGGADGQTDPVTGASPHAGGHPHGPRGK